MAGGQYLFAGLSGMGQAIRDKRDEFEKTQREAESARSTLEFLLPMAQKSGVDVPNLEKLPGMGLGQMKGTISAIAMALDDKRRQEQAKREQERINIEAAYRATALALQEQAQRYGMNQDAAGQRMVMNLANAPSPLNAQGRVAWALENAGGTVSDAALKYAMQGMQESGQNLMPQLMEVGGRKIVVSPGTGRFEFLDGTGGASNVDDRMRLATHNALLSRQNQIMRDLGKPLVAEQRTLLQGELKAIEQRLAEYPRPAEGNATGGADYDYELKNGKLVQRAK